MVVMEDCDGCSLLVLSQCSPLKFLSEPESNETLCASTVATRCCTMRWLREHGDGAGSDEVTSCELKQTSHHSSFPAAHLLVQVAIPKDRNSFGIATFRDTTQKSMHCFLATKALPSPCKVHALLRDRCEGSQRVSVDR
eukprot:g53418.t1